MTLIGLVSIIQTNCKVVISEARVEFFTAKVTILSLHSILAIGESNIMNIASEDLLNPTWELFYAFRLTMQDPLEIKQSGQEFTSRESDLDEGIGAKTRKNDSSHSSEKRMILF